MKPINKFILHVVHNWEYKLNEAYSPSVMARLIEKFKEESEDLNINITDEQLKKYIERFDVLKTSPKISDKDLFNYSLSQLIRLITSSRGAEAPEAASITPDVVYNENGLIIYNGSNEGNCLNFGRGEKWCITRGSFNNYRYDVNRKNCTFYLVKDTNIQPRPGDSNSDDFRKSFFVVVVGSDNTYKVSDRTNNDVGGTGTEWDRWEPWSFVESHFPSIRGLQSVFKYIPLSSAEKITQLRTGNPISIREWIKLPYNVKEQYLVLRKTKTLFSDITVDAFLSKFLPKYPQIASFISTNYGIISSEDLINHLEDFSNSDTRSIFSNMRDTINVDKLSSEIVSFEAKKLITKLNKWTLKNNEHIFLTKDGKAIVKLNVDGDLTMDIYTEFDDFKNVKLTKRTSKYLLDYPELDEIPFKILIKLATDGVIDGNILQQIITNSENEENSNYIIHDTDNGKILIDVKNLSAYKINGDRITSLSFNDEEVQNILNNQEDNSILQDSVLDILKNKRQIPTNLDKVGFFNILNTIPIRERQFNNDGVSSIILNTTTEGEDGEIFIMPSSNTINNPDTNMFLCPIWGNTDAYWGTRVIGRVSKKAMQVYFDYLASQNTTLLWNVFLEKLKNSNTSYTYKKNILLLPNLVINPSDNRVIIEHQGDVYIINTQDPRNSNKLLPSGKIGKVNIPVSAARRLIGNQTPIQNTPTPPEAGGRVYEPLGGERRRGRPAGVGNTPREPQERQRGQVNVSAAFADLGLERGFTTLPRGDFRRLAVNDAVATSTNGDRGASRRDNIMTGSGVVRRVINIGPSKIYIIRLNNGENIASINIQPGNRNYIITHDGSHFLNSPSELMQFLRNQNLAEGLRKSLVKLHLKDNPHMIDEIKNYNKNNK
jgi:hypothetical protein